MRPIPSLILKPDSPARLQTGTAPPARTCLPFSSSPYKFKHKRGILARVFIFIFFLGPATRSRQRAYREVRENHRPQSAPQQRDPVEKFLPPPVLRSLHHSRSTQPFDTSRQTSLLGTRLNLSKIYLTSLASGGVSVGFKLLRSAITWSTRPNSRPISAVIKLSRSNASTMVSISCPVCRT